MRLRSWPESPHYTARHVSGGEQTTAENAGTDTSGWGYSLANLRELLFGCLDAIQAKSVLEVGSYKGELTSDLLAWAEGSGASIAGLDLVLKTSHDALAEIEFPDAIVIDGDHNYFTLREELRIIGERAPGAEIPLLMFHDVCWPHARRDTYYAPERIPEEHRQPIGNNVGLAPGNPGVSEMGLPFIWA